MLTLLLVCRMAAPSPLLLFLASNGGVDAFVLHVLPHLELDVWQALAHTCRPLLQLFRQPASRDLLYRGGYDSSLPDTHALFHLQNGSPRNLLRHGQASALAMDADPLHVFQFPFDRQHVASPNCELLARVSAFGFSGALRLEVWQAKQLSGRPARPHWLLPAGHRALGTPTFHPNSAAVAVLLVTTRRGPFTASIMVVDATRHGWLLASHHTAVLGSIVGNRRLLQGALRIIWAPSLYVLCVWRSESVHAGPAAGSLLLFRSDATFLHNFSGVHDIPAHVDLAFSPDSRWLGCWSSQNTDDFERLDGRASLYRSARHHTVLVRLGCDSSWPATPAGLPCVLHADPSAQAVVHLAPVSILPPSMQILAPSPLAFVGVRQHRLVLCCPATHSLLLWAAMDRADPAAGLVPLSTFVLPAYVPVSTSFVASNNLRLIAVQLSTAWHAPRKLLLCELLSGEQKRISVRRAHQFQTLKWSADSGRLFGQLSRGRAQILEFL